MEQFKNLTDSQTAQQDDNNIIKTTDFNKKNDKKRINYITLCIIKIIVAIGIVAILFVFIGLFLRLYSKEEVKQFIPKIIEWFISAFSGIGLLYSLQKIAKWFKS
ncbi:MAG: hypothetical protein IJT15_01835 [Rickettsiales bacterium]|nr:hypothetical protein [Rickettsiales bacterium]